MTSTSPQHRLILASQSPRRKYLLQKAGLVFQVIPSSVDEGAVPLSDPAAYVKTLARAKALDVAARHPDAWVIGADTIVLIDGAILGKPGSKHEAREMLRHLSGQTHQVYTGYALCRHAPARMITDAVKTDVLFKTLSETEIEWYIRTGEPFDKAGAYAIQGLGTFLVRSIHGSYTNVVGLPVCEVIEALMRESVITLGEAPS
ncbi:nucleoside triphosphate pyrophosphatase [Desulfococcus sp.]|uniref:Maf family protein n=1 Tax=Desulfococcus sp. TaxID=2025834 RepID=UPI00359350AB